MGEQTAVERVLTEDVLTLTAARNELLRITGKRPDKSTMHRWIHNGIDGIKLDAIRLGRDWLTSRQAIIRFIQARTSQSID